MQVSNLLVVILLLVVIWQSHVAGAAYAHESKNKRLQTFARVRSLFSVLVAIFLVVLAWK